MVSEIYKKAFAVLTKKPLRLWGISLLSILVTSLGVTLFGIIPGVPIALAAVFAVAMAMIYLRGYRGGEVEAKDLFFVFSDGKLFVRVLGGMGWKMLWEFIFSLIPIVGWIFAIIKHYEYALTPYILVTEPDVKATDALKLSKERTDGYKTQMFLADLAPVLVYVAAFILLALSVIPFIGVLFAIAAVLLFICAGIFLPLFYGLVHAAFYEEIMAKTAKDDETPTVSE